MVIDSVARSSVLPVPTTVDQPSGSTVGVNSRLDAERLPFDRDGMPLPPPSCATVTGNSAAGQKLALSPDMPTKSVRQRRDGAATLGSSLGASTPRQGRSKRVKDASCPMDSRQDPAAIR